MEREATPGVGAVWIGNKGTLGLLGILKQKCLLTAPFLTHNLSGLANRPAWRLGAHCGDSAGPLAGHMAEVTPPLKPTNKGSGGSGSVFRKFPRELRVL